LDILSGENNMPLKLFVAGTDTNVGKTYISIGLLRLFKNQGYSTIGYKPLAAGAMKKDGRLYNQDALDLSAAATIKLAYEQVNPIVFEPFISPDIAASQVGVTLSLADLNAKSQYTLHQPCDLLLTEGTGGWMQPLNHSETLQDFAAYHQMSVILVVGVRLGCLNHTLLTYQAIKRTGLPIAGWVANCFEINEIDPATIIKVLKSWLPVPYLGMVPYQQAPEEFLQVDHLLQQCSVAD
jgi:dethiobiotin synthetase